MRLRAIRAKKPLRIETWFRWYQRYLRANGKAMVVGIARHRNRYLLEYRDDKWL